MFTLFVKCYLYLNIVMFKVYTDIGGIKKVIPCLSTCKQDNPLAKARGLSSRTGGLYHVCPSVRKIIHSLKIVDYLHVQIDNPWYN